MLFTDFQCPYCARIDPLITRAKNEYAGRINLVVRNFPLPMHKNAKSGAQAVEAAAEQGKLSEMIGLVFDGQKTWSTAPDPEFAFAGYAKELGLDTDKFRADYSSAAVEDRINRDYSDALALGLRGTPSLVLNNRALTVDSSSYATIKEPLDQILGQAQ